MENEEKTTGASIGGPAMAEEATFRRATEQTAAGLRSDIKDIAKRVELLSKALKTAPRSEDEITRDMDSEAIANVMLSYRHLEDASMRLGKMIQASRGGVSVYDKNIESESSAVGS